MRTVTQQALALLILIAVACSPSQEHSTGPSGSIRDYNEVELNRLLAPGTPIAAVTNEFGQPASSTSEGSNSVVYLYSFAFKIDRPASDLAGFSVKFNNGRVIRWLPVTSGVGSSPTREFKVFRATNEDAPLLEILQAKGRASADLLIRQPDAVLHGKAFLGFLGQQRRDEWPIALALDQESAARIHSLTEANVGSQMLIVFETNVIAAPLANTLVGSQPLSFSLRDSNVVERLRSQQR